MNTEIEKKEYVAPAMTVVEMDGENAPILCCSGEGGWGCESDADFE